LKDDEKKYMYGWLWAPKTSMDSFSVLQKVLSGDATFCKKDTEGSLFIVCTYDASNHIVPLVYAFFC